MRLVHPRTRILLFMLAIGALALVAAVGFSSRTIDLNAAVTHIRAMADEPLAPLLFIALYVVLSLLMFPPVILSIAGTLIWGWWIGGLWELAAAFLGAVPPYLMARGAAGGWLRERIRNRHPAIERHLERDGNFTFLLLRIVPVIPYSVLNYLAGLVRIRPLPYLALTLAGMIPSIFIFTWFVDSVAQGVMTEGEVTMRVLIGCALIGVLMIAGRIVMKRLGEN
jgi:phospholipase D1/2